MLHDGLVSDPVPTGKSNARMRQTVGDMVRSMAVVLAVVAAILLVTWRPSPDPVREIDIGPMLSVAASQAEYPIEVPTISGLRPTSVRWEPTIESEGAMVWHVGYVTEMDEYLQITQSTATNPEYLIAQTSGGDVTDVITINGVEWQYFTAPKGNSLLSFANGVTTIIHGTGSASELERAAESLQPSTTQVD
jgi:hypothetical protein